MLHRVARTNNQGRIPEFLEGKLVVRRWEKAIGVEGWDLWHIAAQAINKLAKFDKYVKVIYSHRHNNADLVRPFLAEFGQFWVMRVGNGGKYGTIGNEESITYRPVKTLKRSTPSSSTN